MIDVLAAPLHTNYSIDYRVVGSMRTTQKMLPILCCQVTKYIQWLATSNRRWGAIWQRAQIIHKDLRGSVIRTLISSLLGIGQLTIVWGNLYTSYDTNITDSRTCSLPSRNNRNTRAGGYVIRMRSAIDSNNQIIQGGSYKIDSAVYFNSIKSMGTRSISYFQVSKKVTRHLRFT